MRTWRPQASGRRRLPGTTMSRYMIKAEVAVTRSLPLLACTTLMTLVFVNGATPAPTFHKDVEPIFENRCQSCHRPGEAAPMTFMNYQQVRPWAKAIRSALLTGRMPPWQADPHHGKFTNDLSLAHGEKETILAWINAGVPEGNPAEAPKARVWVDGWRIPKPDVVFEMPEEFSV